MVPVEFASSNINLTAPAGQEARVSTLPAYTNGEYCVSCWRLNWRERFSALLFGTVWLSVLSGHTQPPVALRAERT